MIKLIGEYLSKVQDATLKASYNTSMKFLKMEPEEKHVIDLPSGSKLKDVIEKFSELLDIKSGYPKDVKSEADLPPIQYIITGSEMAALLLPDEEKIETSLHNYSECGFIERVPVYSYTLCPIFTAFLFEDREEGPVLLKRIVWKY